MNNGKTNFAVVPLLEDSIVNVPSCISIIFLAIAKPSPDPLSGALAPRVNLSNNFGI